MEKDRTTDFSSGSIPRHLIVFSLPMFAGNLLQALYNTVDSIWVGLFLGKNALAAVSVGFPVILALVSLVMGLTMATTIMVSQYAGAKRPEMVRSITANSLGLLIVSGLFLSALGVLFHRAILSAIRTPPAVFEAASSYLSVFLSGLIFMFLYNGASAILRGLGDSRSPTWFLLYATGINILLDPLLIFGWGPIPRLGVAGAAWATVLAQGFAAVLALNHLYRSGQLLDKDWRRYLPQAGLTWRTVVIGLPAGLQQVVVSLGALALTSLVNSFGETVTAAFGAAARLDQFAFLPTMSISLATSALVGQNLGAGWEHRAHETLRWSALLAAGITTMVTLAAMTFPRPILSIFTRDAAVIDEGARYLRLVSLGYVPLSLMFAINGLLRGAGDTLPSMITSISALWLVRLPLATWLARMTAYGTRGIWIGMAASPVVGLIISYLYYRSGRWRRKILVGPEQEKGRG